MHQIAFGYDAHNPADMIDDRDRTYVLLKQDPCDFSNSRIFPYGNNGRNHHVARLHGPNSLLWLPAGILRVSPGRGLIRVKPAHLAAAKTAALNLE
jgi:hypothetical protein